MYVCIYVLHVCVYVYVCMYVCIYVCTNVCIACVYMYVYMYVGVNFCGGSDTGDATTNSVHRHSHWALQDCSIQSLQNPFHHRQYTVPDFMKFDISVPCSRQNSPLDGTLSEINPFNIKITFSFCDDALYVCVCVCVCVTKLYMFMCDFRLPTRSVWQLRSTGLSHSK